MLEGGGGRARCGVQRVGANGDWRRLDARFGVETPLWSAALASASSDAGHLKAPLARATHPKTGKDGPTMPAHAP
jgi:hypothetical protein